MKNKVLLAGIAFLSLNAANAVTIPVEEFGNPDFYHVVKTFKSGEDLEIKGQKYKVLRKDEQPIINHGQHGWKVMDLYNPCYEGEFDRLGFTPRLLDIQAAPHIPENVDFSLFHVEADPYKDYYTLRYSATNNPDWNEDVKEKRMFYPDYCYNEICSGVKPEKSVNFLLHKIQ